MNLVSRWRSGHLSVLVVLVPIILVVTVIFLVRQDLDFDLAGDSKHRSLGAVEYESECLSNRDFVDASVLGSVPGSTVNLHLAISRSAGELTKGLSGVSCLGEKEGMLFVFENSSIQGIWMKDMLMPLDILWLDEGGKIVHIEERVSQYSFPQVFSPQTQAKYVIELKSGSVQKFSYKIGDKFTFNGI